MYALGYSRDSVFQRSFATLKRYNDSCYKVVLMKSCRLPGFEEIGIIKTGKRNSAGNTKKLEASLSRTKNRVRSCNILPIVRTPYWGSSYNFTKPRPIGNNRRTSPCRQSQQRLVCRFILRTARFCPDSNRA